FQLFLKHGYKGVSLNDIIANSGLSKGAIYHHFDSKYAIYLAAIDHYYFQMMDHSFLPFGEINTEDEGQSFLQRLRTRFESFANLLEAIEALTPYPIRTFFIFQLESEQDPAIRERVISSLNIYRKEVNEMVEKAIANEELINNLPASTIAQQLISMIEGLAIHHSTIEKDGKAFLLQKFDEVIASYINLLTPKHQTT
ncbi:MAG: TetR/AcrR family transcriptional regulator, partial [Bacteroidota bacterium]